MNSTSTEGVAAPLSSTLHAVTIHELRKSYPGPTGKVDVLDGISGVIEKGQIVLLSGVSGSGKSTLLHIIGGIDGFDDGEVVVSGIDLSLLRERQRPQFRARNIGFVFQFFNLLPMLTVLENVTAALEPLNIRRKEQRTKALAMLEAVGMAAHATKFPAQLSGGEQQRVSIARAMVKQPPLILADEPTGALDHANAKHVLDCLKKLQESARTTVIIATHDPFVREYADVEWTLAEGTVEVNQL